MTKEIVARAKDYATLLRRNAVSAAQQNALWPMILSLLVPSIVLLILGSALAWVLTGFRREKPARP